MFFFQKTGAATILIGGWGLVLYVLQYMWQNCLTILKEYHTVAVGKKEIIFCYKF